MAMGGATSREPDLPSWVILKVPVINNSLAKQAGKVSTPMVVCEFMNTWVKKSK